jgi:hypothetical protein
MCIHYFVRYYVRPHQSTHIRKMHYSTRENLSVIATLPHKSHQAIFTEINRNGHEHEHERG